MLRDDDFNDTLFENVEIDSCCSRWKKEEFVLNTSILKNLIYHILQCLDI